MDRISSTNASSHFVWFKVVQTEDGVKPFADFVVAVLVLGQFCAWGGGGLLI